MSRLESPSPVVYPESDGQPMAETPLHGRVMRDVMFCLEQRYRNRADVYVGGNMFFYYEKGNPKAAVAPDVFAMFGVPERDRRVVYLWDEPRAPSFVLEVTSKSTRLEDEGNKKGLYLRLGVDEYFLFDPEGDYLEPRLIGFRRNGDEFRSIRPGPGGVLESQSLGLRFVAEDARLRMIDCESSELQLWPDELDAARERAEAEVEALRRRIAEIEGAEIEGD